MGVVSGILNILFVIIVIFLLVMLDFGRNLVIHIAKITIFNSLDKCVKNVENLLLLMLLKHLVELGTKNILNVVLAGKILLEREIFTISKINHCVSHVS